MGKVFSKSLNIVKFFGIELINYPKRIKLSSKLLLANKKYRTEKPITNFYNGKQADATRCNSTQAYTQNSNQSYTPHKQTVTWPKTFIYTALRTCA